MSIICNICYSLQIQSSYEFPRRLAKLQEAFDAVSQEDSLLCYFGRLSTRLFLHSSVLILLLSLWWQFARGSGFLRGRQIYRLSVCGNSKASLGIGRFLLLCGGKFSFASELSLHMEASYCHIWSESYRIFECSGWQSCLVSRYKDWQSALGFRADFLSP